MPLRVLVWFIAALALAALPGACGPTVPVLPASPSPVSGSGGGAGGQVHTADGGPEVRIADQPPPAPATDADARGTAGPDGHDAAAPDAQGIATPNDGAAAREGGPNDGTGGAAPTDGGRGGSDDALVSDGPPPAQPRAGEVIIDELLVNPAGTDTNREWIEIVNTTALALDLRTLHVADGSKEVAIDAGVMAPGAILALGQSIDPAKNGGAPIAVAYGNTISLNNDGDSITICFGSCSDGLILSSVRWGSDLGAGYDGHAVVVAPDTGAFCPATLPFGTAGSFGTPGAANPPCAGLMDADTDAGADSDDARTDGSSD